jgi:hypothetical protein
MASGQSGPPNKWSAFSTKDMRSPEEFAQQLSNLAAQGFTGPVVAVPDPTFLAGTSHSISWVAVGGYKKDE